MAKESDKKPLGILVEGEELFYFVSFNPRAVLKG